MMTGREVVLRSLEFSCPERIPLLEKDPFVTRKDADMVILYWRPRTGFVPLKSGMDEWGCMWKSMNPEAGDQGQVVEHPLFDWKKASGYLFPDPFAPGRVEWLEPSLKDLRKSGKFLCGSLGHGPMHLLPDIRGFEGYLTDMVEYPERTEFLLDGIFNFLTGLTLRYSGMKLDAIWIWDDQATQNGLLFSIKTWCRFFKPRYTKLFDLAHSRGMKIFMHTCGHIGEHLPHLIDSGVDAIDNKQPSLWMDSPSAVLAKGRISFSTCLDIQTTINNIPLEKVEEETSRLVRRLSIPSGGFIGTCYSSKDLGIPVEKTYRMIKSFKNFRWD